MNKNNFSFGKRIRDMRISKNMSQEKLAELSGLHPTYIGQIEREEKSPTLESIYKLSGGLGVCISKLFYNMQPTEKSDDNDFDLKIYNKIISLSEIQKEKLYKIICEIINFDK